MSISYGSRRLVVGAHYGVRDWLAQRITSILMAIFTVVLVVQVLMPGPLDYYKWSAIFAHQWMRVLTFATIVALLFHVWVGMRDIWMDYVKPVSARLALDLVTMAWLVGCAGWAIQVLWRL
jgi:succinate dehydrogenase / fumarate reductase, membrane anchor subunit